MVGKAFLIGAVALALAAGCSSSDDTEPVGEPVAVEIVALGMYPNQMEGFTASGDAVSSGVVCADGGLIWQGNTTPDGDEFSEADFADGMAAGETFEFSVVVDYECSDGSGTFTLTMDVIFDPATNTQTKTWRIEAGTDEHDGLTGTGVSEQLPAPDLQTIHTGRMQSG